MTAEAGPSRPRSGGCLGKGCLVLAGLAVLLAVALAAGALWGIQRLRQTYSATEQLTLPTASGSVGIETSASDHSAVTPEQLRQVQTRWESFQRAGLRREQARLELTPAEINALIQADPELRGKAFVSIDNNVARVRVSIPLNEFLLMEGRYLNGEATVAASADGDPTKARISDIVLANQTVPDNILDRCVFGWLPIRTLINEWLAERRITTFQIQDNKVIGETLGSP